MYRRLLPSYNSPQAIEAHRKEAFDLINETHTLVLAVPRRKDQRKYRSQTVYIYQNLLQSPNYFDAL